MNEALETLEDIAHFETLKGPPGPGMFNSIYIN
jgi:hypothetical protein